MNEHEYRKALSVILEDHTASARIKLAEVLKNLPRQARSIQIVVSPEQGGEGAFSVHVTLDGPDLYVLNKAIRGWAELFTVRHASYGLDPPVPLMDAFGETFEVNDAVVDVAAGWVQRIWQTLEDLHPRLPATVTGHDEYGTVTPITLTP